MEKLEIPRDWTFKTADIAGGFDRHVREQLPWYDLTTGLIAHFARHYIPEGGQVYDIGASTGNIGNAIRDTLESRKAQLVAVDNSEAMRPLYKGPGEFTVADAESFDFQPFDLSVLFLTLMFIRPAVRGGLIKKLRDNLRPGGAILIFDKCVQGGGYVGTITSRLALAGKVAAGVDAREIVAKELSLAGVQRPIELREIEPCTELFRFGDFAGFIIEG
jgi:tRNA (cmo5U34)-methyltransferase